MPVLQTTYLKAYSVETTGKKIIKRALRLIGATDPDEEPTAAELANGLEALNKMLDAWNSEGLMLYARTMYSVSTALRSPTLGPGGTLDMPRPQALADGDVFLKDGTVNYPVSIMSQAEWGLLEALTTGVAVPGRAYYDRQTPLGTLNFDVTPDKAYTLEVYDNALLQQITNANASITLPPSYADALDYNLAVRQAPEYGREASPSVLDLAVNLRAKIQRKNTTIAPVVPDGFQRGGYDIDTDTLRG